MAMDIKNFRPQTFDDCIGQEKAKKMLKIYIKSAEMRGETLDHILLSAESGFGKAQPVDTIVPTPDGYKKLGELKIGDYVFDRCGNPTEVLGIFPQGELDTYKVTLADGRFTYCNNEHLWSVYTKSAKSMKTITLQELIDSGIKESSGQYKFKIPVNKRLYFSKKDFSVHPYIVGAFLGDGCCLQRQLTISSDSEEIPCTIASFLPDTYRAVPVKNSDNNCSWTFRLSAPYYSNNHLVEKVQTRHLFAGIEEELCQDSYHKRIPEQYFYGSREQRLDLLRGLLDTDGYARNNDGRAGITFSSVNKGLVLDVIRLVRELGFYTGKITEDKRDKYKEGTSYIITISCDDSIKPELFYLQRKKNTLKEAISNKKHHYDYSKMSIVDIHKMEYKTQMVCIYVDNEEHLYLTNDCIVTHNTTFAQIIANEAGKNLKVYSCPAIKTIDDVKDILLSIEDGDMVLFDEVQSLKKKIQEITFLAMEQFVVDSEIDGIPQRINIPHFTLIACTTELGGLELPMRNRFQIQIHLHSYNDDDMSIIVKNCYRAMNVDIDDNCAAIIARSCRGVPRIANSYVRRIYDMALVTNDGKITKDVIEDAFELMDINKYGLSKMDMDYLTYLARVHKAVGVDTIATALGTDRLSLESTVEPYLIKQGMIVKGARGRSITDYGMRIVKEF